MEKAEGRRILKCLQALVTGRGDEEAAEVLAEVKAFAEAELASLKPTRRRRGGRDRMERGGEDREE